MKVLIFALLSFSAAAQIPANYYEKDMAARAYQFEKSRPSYEVGRAIMPGMLGFMGGAINTETMRGRAVQQAIFFTGAVSIGAWQKRKTKFILLDAGCFLVGAALGFAIGGKPQ